MTPQLAYYDLGPNVTAFSTTRHGGCSQGNYATMNVNAYCGDAAAAVAENRRLLARQLAVSTSSRILIPHQVHGSHVVCVDEDFLSLPSAAQQQRLEGVDALVTSQCHVCIGVSTADCIPVILYDAVHHCAAVVHAGWRGTVKRIARETALQLHSLFHSSYDQLRAVIGPGISLKNFEVGQEVYDEFCHAGFPMQQIADTATWPKPHINLPLCNALQLQELGVPASNIFDCGICTFDHVDDYFSARRLGVQSGRIYTGVALH